jgi:glycerol-3-phosphate cytidylyltransferase
MNTTPEIGFVAGAFQIIHPGYLRMLKEAQENCHHLFVLLHDDPSIERPEKGKPIFPVEERAAILKQLVDCQVLTYNTEAELHQLIKSLNPDVRFMGEDYMGKEYTGIDLDIPVHWILRGHGWSFTKVKEMIYESRSKRII